MAKTLENLQVGVRVYLDEVQQTDFLDTEINRSINYAYQDFISHVMEVYEDFYSTTTPIQITTVADQQEYSLDTSLIKVTRVEVNYKPSDSNSKPLRAIPIKMSELPRYLDNLNTGGSGLFNCGYYIHGKLSVQKIGFVPIPENGGSNAAEVWGVQLPSDLIAGGSVDIPYADRFAYLIELYAAGILLRKGQQEETAAARYITEYQAGILQMKTFLVERQSDGVRMIEDSLFEDVAMDNAL